MKLWGGRFKKGTNDLVNDFNSSIRVDSRMYKEDVEGSLAHVKMLGKQKIIPSKASKKIEDGLNEMLKRMDNGVIGIDPSSEDIHSFIEGTLTYYIGDEGKMLHTEITKPAIIRFAAAMGTFLLRKIGDVTPTICAKKPLSFFHPQNFPTNRTSGRKDHIQQEVFQMLHSRSPPVISLSCIKS